MIQGALLGYELDWLAIDKFGHVGWFCTAGGGIAPTDIVERIDIHRRAIESIETLAQTTLAAEGPAEDEWRAAAVRGVFVFDSSFNRDPYKRVATPREPLRIEDLPASLAVARRLEIRCDFRELAIIPTALIDELG